MPSKTKTRTKKASPKRATKTKARSKARTKRASKSTSSIPTAQPGQYFWVHNGPILGDLKELQQALESGLDEEQFNHHVAGDRNDFAEWVEHVFGQSDCAKKLRKVKTRKSMAKAVGDCLK